RRMASSAHAHFSGTLMQDSSEGAAEWVRLTATSTTLEAEMLRQALEEEDIPVLLRGTYSGVFGGAYQGPVPGGVHLLVPSPLLEDARRIIGDPEEDQG